MWPLQAARGVFCFHVTLLTPHNGDVCGAVRLNQDVPKYKCDLRVNSTFTPPHKHWHRKIFASESSNKTTLTPYFHWQPQLLEAINTAGVRLPDMYGLFIIFLQGRCCLRCVRSKLKGHLTHDLNMWHVTFKMDAATNCLSDVPCTDCVSMICQIRSHSDLKMFLTCCNALQPSAPWFNVHFPRYKSYFNTRCKWVVRLRSHQHSAPWRNAAVAADVRRRESRLH